MSKTDGESTQLACLAKIRKKWRKNFEIKVWPKSAFLSKIENQANNAIEVKMTFPENILKKKVL